MSDEAFEIHERGDTLVMVDVPYYKAQDKAFDTTARCDAIGFAAGPDNLVALSCGVGIHEVREALVERQSLAVDEIDDHVGRAFMTPDQMLLLAGAMVKFATRMKIRNG